MSKTYNVKMTIYTDRYGEEYCHEVHDEENNPSANLNFTASDLCECPEDATLYRDLFNGYDYIETLKTGMMLAQMGYDSIEVIEEENKE